MINLIRIAQYLACGALFAFPALAADVKTWVSPAFKTGSPEGKEIVTIDHYAYREAAYDPQILVDHAVSRSEARDDKPEYAFISRISAMMSSNYDWWLATWDKTGRELTLQNDAEKGATSNAWVKQWNQVFSGVRMVLIRRIVTGKYVVMTYGLRTLDGRPASSFELPVVLCDQGGRWYSTLDLRRDPLLPASPWVSGKDSMDVTVR